jgi:hypothetical protein
VIRVTGTAKKTAENNFEASIRNCIKRDTTLPESDVDLCWKRGSVFMVGQTIVERLCQTKSLAARHILQDEAAIHGAQGKVGEQLEAKLAQVEESELKRTLGMQYVVRERVDAMPTCPEAKDQTPSEAYRARTQASESDSTRVELVEWLRGKAIVRPCQDDLEPARDQCALR